MPSSNDLDFFVAVVQSGNLTRAASRLCLSTATVSKRLHRLEKRLGVRLAQRDARGFSLTSAGKYYFEQSVNLANEISRIETSLSNWDESGSAALRIGVTDGIYDRLLAPVFASFVQAHPKIQLELVASGHGARPVEQGLDCFFLNGHPDDFGPRLARIELCEAPLILCASPAYLAQAGTPKQPLDLEAHACLVATNRRDTILRNWHFQRGRERLSVRIQARVSALGWQVRDLAVRGLGIALLPRHLVASEIENNQLNPLLPSWTANPLRYVYMVHNSEYRLIPGLEKFSDFVSAFFSIEYAG